MTGVMSIKAAREPKPDKQKIAQVVNRAQAKEFKTWLVVRLAKVIQGNTKIMSLPVFRSVQNSTAEASSSITVAKPAGVVNGDLLIAAHLHRGGFTFTPPAGWTLLQDSGAGDTRLVTYWKIAASEGASYTFSAGGTYDSVIAVAAFIGADSVTPIQASGKASAVSSTPSAPTLTNSIANSLLLTIFGSNSGGSWTPPSGMTERFDGLGSDSTASLEIAELAVPATGATGSKQATNASSGQTYSHSVLVSPAGGAPADQTKGFFLA